jgi:hypothetical protein
MTRSNCGHFNITIGCNICEAIQSKWYRRVNKKGFRDIEASDGLLRSYSGACGIPPTIGTNEEGSNWPSPIFGKEEEFLNHPEFEDICEKIFKHGDNKVRPHLARKVWKLHCEGKSLREIETATDICYSSINRAVKRIKEFINLMDLDRVIVVLRPFVYKDDAPFIFSTWRRSVWFDSHPQEELIPDGFYRKDIKEKLTNPENNVRVACSKDNESHIFGFSVMQKDLLEFVYVKVEMRHHGIARLLTEGFAHIAEPLTKIGRAIAKNKNLRRDNDPRRDDSGSNS